MSWRPPPPGRAWPPTVWMMCTSWRMEAFAAGRVALDDFFRAGTASRLLQAVFLNQLELRTSFAVALEAFAGAVRKKNLSSWHHTGH